ncbi:MAG: hypothetical protein Alpg2KO_02210 [Alphaproteobacteria bacterium]
MTLTAQPALQSMRHWLPLVLVMCTAFLALPSSKAEPDCNLIRAVSGPAVMARLANRKLHFAGTGIAHHYRADGTVRVQGALPGGVILTGDWHIRDDVICYGEPPPVHHYSQRPVCLPLGVDWLGTLYADRSANMPAFEDGCRPHLMQITR